MQLKIGKNIEPYVSETVSKHIPHTTRHSPNTYTPHNPYTTGWANKFMLALLYAVSQERTYAI